MPLSEIPPPINSSDASAGQQPPLMRVAPPGPMSRGWAMRGQQVEPTMTFEPPPPDEAEQPPPIVYASALGSNVVDVDGNRYVDMAAGFGSVLIGHRPQRVYRSLEMQIDRTWTALGDVFPADAKIALLERLASLFPEPGAKALLGLTGSDAVTIALKTAALHTSRAGVVAFSGGYHGLGHGPLAACGYRAAFRQPFAGQLNPHVTFAPFPHSGPELADSLDVVGRALQTGEVGAVLVEPILGRGGCVVPPTDFLPSLLDLTHEHGAVLVADEIWTGLGRSGHMMASVAGGVVPDLVCFGKGLGGGLPVSACVGRGHVMDAWERSPGAMHTSTFQGYPLGCTSAVATIDVVRSKKLAERSQRVGAEFMKALRAKTGNQAVSGSGLMVGVSLPSSSIADKVRRALLSSGYITLTGGVKGNVLTLTPPLTIAQDLLDGFVDRLAWVLTTAQ